MLRIDKKNITIGFLLVMWLITIASFIITPFTSDLKVFMASANQSNYISKNLFLGAYQAWELKSVFSRTLMYLIYKIAIIFVPFGTYSFEVVCKMIYIIFLQIMIWQGVKYIFGSKNLIYTLLISVCFTALHTGCQMQVEMTCSLLALMAFSLYYNAIYTGRRIFFKLFLAGVLIGSFFYFKSVLILLSVSIVSAVCICNIYHGKALSIKRLAIVIAGSIFILILNYILILWINPNEINDILNASAFQNTLFTTGISVKSIPGIILRSLYHFLTKSHFVPVVLVGAIAFVINFIWNIIDKNVQLIFFHIVMWMMPAVFVILSNQYFIYHFVSFIFPSMIEIYCCCKKRKINNMIIIIGLLYAIVIYMINFSFFSNSVKKYIECDKKSYGETDMLLTSLNFDPLSEVLYLDDGCGAYMLGNHSYLKYYFPLPLQRLDDSSALECYKQSKDMALNYDGKYISVYEKWFWKNNKNQEIKKKIEEEYKLIGQYAVFSPPHALGTNKIEIRYYNLYERE